MHKDIITRFVSVRWQTRRQHNNDLKRTQTMQQQQWWWGAWVKKNSRTNYTQNAFVVLCASCIISMCSQCDHHPDICFGQGCLNKQLAKPTNSTLCESACKKNTNAQEYFKHEYDRRRWFDRSVLSILFHFQSFRLAIRFTLEFEVSVFISDLPFWSFSDSFFICARSRYISYSVRSRSGFVFTFMLACAFESSWFFLYLSLVWIYFWMGFSLHDHNHARIFFSSSNSNKIICNYHATILVFFLHFHVFLCFLV